MKLVVNVDFSDIESILDDVHEIKADRKISEKIYDLFKKEKENVGFTFSKSNNRKSILVIGNSSDSKSFLNTFTHEITHLAVHISKRLNIPFTGEEFCYLVGEIAEMMYDDVKVFLE